MPNTCHLPDEITEYFETISFSLLYLEKVRKFCKSKYFRKQRRKLVKWCLYILRNEIVDLDYHEKINEDVLWAFKRFAIAHYNDFH